MNTYMLLHSPTSTQKCGSKMRERKKQTKLPFRVVKHDLQILWTPSVSITYFDLGKQPTLNKLFAWKQFWIRTLIKLRYRWWKERWTVNLHQRCSFLLIPGTFQYAWTRPTGGIHQARVKCKKVNYLFIYLFLGW